LASLLKQKIYHSNTGFKRPALCFFAAMAFAVAAVYKSGIHTAIILAAVSFTAFIVSAALKKYACVPVLAAIICGAVLSGVFLHGQKSVDGITAIKGTVTSADISYSTRQVLTVKTSQIFKKDTAEKSNLVFTVYTRPGIYVKRNDECIFSGSVEKGRPGTEHLMFANDIYYCRSTKGGALEMIYSLRDMLVASADRLLPQDEAAVAKALTVGSSVYLCRETKELFSAAGIAHILSVSGLHTALVYAMLVFFLKLFKISNRKRTISGMIFLPLYAVLTGLNVPCVRAVIMLEALFFGILTDRRNDGINCLSFAGIIILFFQPTALFQAGFQLSFLSVLSLMLMPKSYEKYTGVLKYAVEVLIASVFITIFTFPVMAYHFYSFPLYGFLTNLLVLPISGLLVCFSMLSLLCGIFSRTIGLIFAASDYFIIKYTEFICAFTSSLPFGSVQTGRLPAAFTVLYYAGLAIPFAVHIKKQALLLSADIAAIFCVLFSNRMIFKKNTYYFLSETNGGCEIIQSYNGHTYLCGGSERNSSTDYAENAADFCFSIGVTRLDAVFVSDIENPDFYLNLLEHIKTGTIIIPCREGENADTIKAKAGENGTDTIVVSCGDSTVLDGGIKATCILPTGKEPENMANAVYGFSDNDFDFADISSADETQLRFLTSVSKRKYKAAASRYYSQALPVADTIFDQKDSIKIRGDKKWLLQQ